MLFGILTMGLVLISLQLRTHYCNPESNMAWEYITFMDCHLVGRIVLFSLVIIRLGVIIIN